MAGALTLELGRGPHIAPVFLGQVAKVQVHSLGDEGAGRDGTETRGLVGVFFVTFVEDESMSGIELFKTGKFNVVEDCIDKEAKVIDSRLSSKSPSSQSPGWEPSCFKILYALAGLLFLSIQHFLQGNFWKLFGTF